MQISTIQPELLVPPRRLGGLLADARLRRGHSLEEASAELGGGWTPLHLLEIETGRRVLDDKELKQLTGFYDIPTTTLIPERSRLIIDLNEGTLALGADPVSALRVDLERSDVQRREVLARYLSMVYAMREVEPGRQIPLRLPDLEVLEQAFGTHRRDLEDELRSMMLDTTGSVGFRTRRLRGRVLVPVVGVLVAATAVGALLLVANESGASTDPVGGAGDPVAVEIGDAVVQERLPDGSPGPVLPRD